MMQPSTVDVPVAKTNQAFRFSIRDLLIVIAAIGFVLGGFQFFGLFGASVIVLGISVLLIARGRRTNASWIRPTGIVLLIGSTCVCGSMLAAWVMFGVGPIYSAVSYPSEFRRMVKSAMADTWNAKISGLGGFLDSEYVWRITLSPDQLDHVIAEFGLGVVPTEKVPASFRLMFPRWWRPKHTEDSRYYSTSNFPDRWRGEDGPHYFTMYDSKNQRLYVWHKSNF